MAGTSSLQSPKSTPDGVPSATTPGKKPNCLSKRSGGEGPGAMSVSCTSDVASFSNSWIYPLKVWGPYSVEAPWEITQDSIPVSSKHQNKLNSSSSGSQYSI